MIHEQREYEYIVPKEKIAFFQKHGFATIENVIAQPELDRYVSLMSDMISGKISTEGKRDDMNAHEERVRPEIENCVQIHHPYVLTKDLDGCEFFRKGKDICNQLYGPFKDQTQDRDFTLEQCQFLCKFPKTNTETPWHQDAAYWDPLYFTLPDDVSGNIWMALEDCTIESGCLAFSPVSLRAKSIAKHWRAGNERGPLTCGSPPKNKEIISTPLKAGDAVVFNVYTYHYGHANISNKWRPAFVGLYRPKRMIHRILRLGVAMGKMLNT